MGMAEPKWVVKKASPNPDYTIDLEFADGQQRVFDASYLLEVPIFAPLKSIPFFMMARVKYGTVIWTEDIDIAPERLYEASVPGKPA